MRSVALMLGLICAVGCGGSDSVRAHRRTTPVAHHERARRTDRQVRLDDERHMEADGLTGSLSSIAVRSALTPRTRDFSQCFVGHSRRVRGLGGRIEFFFRVGPDGNVQEVRPTHSTLGHRAVERCLMNVAYTTQFARPDGGGSATFTWPLEMDAARQPVTLDYEQVQRVVRRNASAVLRECRPRGSDASYEVTTYVSRGGRVVSAGAVSTDAQAEELDCVVREVRRWRMPRPRAHQAKTTFELG